MFIQPRDSEDAAELARKLLDAAGDDQSRVKTSFQGAQLGFEVDDDLATAVGRTPDREANADPNAQPIIRDTVGEAPDTTILPNVMPGARDDNAGGGTGGDANPDTEGTETVQEDAGGAAGSAAPEGTDGATEGTDAGTADPAPAKSSRKKS